VPNFGHEANELIGQTPRILQGELTNKDSLQRIRRELSSGDTCNVGIVNFRKDGTPHDVELFISPVVDANGKHTNFVSIQRDITQRKLLAEALRREHEFNRSIVETSQSVTLVLDTDARIVEFNPYLEKITGWRFDELKGRDWFDTFVPEPEKASMHRVFQDALAGNITQGLVSPVLTKDDQQRFIEWFILSPRIPMVV
jgi:two-component system, LuxR family, sensor kinase FixL